MKHGIKKTAFAFLVLAAIGLTAQQAGTLKGTPPGPMPFYVYLDYGNMKNHYIPSGYMGDFGDIQINNNIRKNTKAGTSCLRLTYSGKALQGQQWAGVYWQNPANNWGGKQGGYDLSTAKKLTFWARGQKGGETVEFKMGGIKGKYADTGTETSGTVNLTKEWKQFSISLEDVLATYISGGFCAVFTKAANPDGCVFYLDEIRYE